MGTLTRLKNGGPTVTCCRYPLRQHGKEGAPQHGEAGHQQHQVVEQKARLARDQRIETMLALQRLAVAHEEEHAGGEGDGQEPYEPDADARLREEHARN